METPPFAGLNQPGKRAFFEVIASDTTFGLMWNRIPHLVKWTPVVNLPGRNTNECRMRMWRGCLVIALERQERLPQPCARKIKPD